MRLCGIIPDLTHYRAGSQARQYKSFGARLQGLVYVVAWMDAPMDIENATQIFQIDSRDLAYHHPKRDRDSYVVPSCRFLSQDDTPRSHESGILNSRGGTSRLSRVPFLYKFNPILTVLLMTFSGDCARARGLL